MLPNLITMCLFALRGLLGEAGLTHFGVLDINWLHQPPLNSCADPDQMLRSNPGRDGHVLCLLCASPPVFSGHPMAAIGGETSAAIAEIFPSTACCCLMLLDCRLVIGQLCPFCIGKGASSFRNPFASNSDVDLHSLSEFLGGCSSIPLNCLWYLITSGLRKWSELLFPLCSLLWPS